MVVEKQKMNLFIEACLILLISCLIFASSLLVFLSLVGG